MIAPDYNPKGTCATGYSGMLCADCLAGYSRSTSFECKTCPDKLGNAMKLLGILAAYIIIMVLMIRSTLKGAL